MSGLGYDYKIDYWSLGVMIYKLVSGLFPFNSDKIQQIYKSIINCHYNFDSKVWNNVSSECKDLICNLLTANPEKRFDSKLSAKV